jgi:hypothetical protein
MLLIVFFILIQGCGSGSGSVLDPDSMGLMDPDSESRSGSLSKKKMKMIGNFFFKNSTNFKNNFSVTVYVYYINYIEETIF